MVDDGHEFKGAVAKLLSKHNVQIRRADPGHHRSQAFVESFNRRLAERIFRKQAQEELYSGRDNSYHQRHEPHDHSNERPSAGRGRENV